MRCGRVLRSSESWGFLKWAAQHGVRTDLVKHTLISKDAVNGVPVRGIIASRTIERGERVAEIPAQCVLTGQTVWPIVQRLYGGGVSGVRRVLDSVEERLAEVCALGGEMNQNNPAKLDQHAMLATRDALLITLALHALRFDHRLRTHPLHDWVAAFPQRIPPMASIAQAHLSSRHDPTKVKPQRRLRAGDRSIDLLPDGSNRETAATELMIAQAGDQGLEHVSKARTEVVPTEAIMTSFFTGQTAPLSPRQQESASTQVVEDHGVMQCLLQMDSMLRLEVLTSLAVGLVGSGADALDALRQTGANNAFRVDEDSLGMPLTPLPVSDSIHRTPASTNVTQIVDELQWSHYSVRSRSINVLGGFNGELAQKPHLALVPLLDMLNHHPTKQNVVYRMDSSVRDAAGKVVLTTSRRIERGEELLLNYDSYNQRGCLFGDVSAQQRSTRASTLNEAVRKQEQQMRYDMIDDSDDNLRDALILDELERATAPLPSRGPERRAKQLSRATEASVKDAKWLWRFGFLKNASEKEQEAERLWKRALMKRVSRLTDVRKRGERGGYVVGVPEGLHSIHEQRERLQRERYGGASVFPPQKD